MPRAAFTLLLPLLVTIPAVAQPPQELILPIACTPGADCWVLRHVDHDPGPGVRDYMCGALTGDGHKGTDVALRDLSAMASGVAVRAAAAGVVDALRDGVADVSVDEIGRAAVGGKECGNGIRLAHGDGWTTWYCHLRRGSLMVEQGDRVVAGQPLALVGLSGDTSFPHLHFDVRHGDQPIDPFVGIVPAGNCGPGPQPLWASTVGAALRYQPILLMDAGFATAAPQKEDVRRGWHRLPTLPVTSPALVLWVEGYWVEPGDRVIFRLRGPDGGAVVDHVVEVDHDQQRWLGFAGAPRPGAGWPAGTYEGDVTLERSAAEGPLSVTLERSIQLFEP
ncbi:MAG TPA: M23 family metallopeptidase [Geminicoccaceae bacterium]